jgi:hypothetical protein
MEGSPSSSSSSSSRVIMSCSAIIPFQEVPYAGLTIELQVFG